jgi:acetyltransferase-like isoleucine patch superfamily enzyme/glycosyltransferase involved in cell wall biosynthesis
MSDFPLVTIVTPSLNQGKYIEDTINSVLAQTYPHVEYIVVDAMSTDNTRTVLERYAERITRIIREPDGGQSDAIVKGFRLAKGELVGWINSDDILYPECIVKIVEAYRKCPEAVLFWNSRVHIIDTNGLLRSTVAIGAVDRDSLLRRCTNLVQPGSFYRREALTQSNYFDVNLRFSMDLDLWLRLLKIGACVDLDGEPIAAYREWEGTKTLTGGVRLLRERKQLLLDHGAAVWDRTMIRINWNLLKGAFKDSAVVRRGRAVLRSVRRVTCLCAYYGMARHLPASSTRYAGWCRAVRRACCMGLFRLAGKNINVERGAVFGTGSKISIGDNSGIGVNCRLSGEVRIGRNVMMGPEVLFITTTYQHKCIDVPMIEQGFAEDRPIVIGDDVWIGTRCILLPGVNIGNGVILGAGSVVSKSLPDHVVAAGNPVRVIRSRLPRSDAMFEVSAVEA